MLLTKFCDFKLLPIGG